MIGWNPSTTWRIGLADALPQISLVGRDGNSLVPLQYRNPGAEQPFEGWADAMAAVQGVATEAPLLLGQLPAVALGGYAAGSEVVA